MPQRKKGKGSQGVTDNQIINKNKGSKDADAGDKPKLTPYQGKRQAFGMFRCQKCNRHWTSSVSWANFGQECKKCRITVYPFAQFPLESDESKELNKSDPVKPHPVEMCEKCRSLGRFCGEKENRFCGEKKNPRRRRRRQNKAATAARQPVAA